MQDLAYLLDNYITLMMDDVVCYYFGTLAYHDLFKRNSKSKLYGGSPAMGTTVERFRHDAIQISSSGRRSIQLSCQTKENDHYILFLLRGVLVRTSTTISTPKVTKITRNIMTRSLLYLTEERQMYVYSR